MRSIYFESLPYRVHPETGLIDFDELRKTVLGFQIIDAFGIMQGSIEGRLLGFLQGGLRFLCGWCKAGLELIFGSRGYSLHP